MIRVKLGHGGEVTKERQGFLGTFQFSKRRSTEAKNGRGIGPIL